MLTDLAPSAAQVALTIQLAVAPIFLLAGVGAFLNVCAGRLSRIVDRARQLEQRLPEKRGSEHARLLEQIRILDRRMALVSRAIFLAVLSAILTCAVVILLFAGGLTDLSFGTPIAILFIATMVAIGAGFFVFLIETRLGAKAVRISSEILQHEPGEQD
jgi:hypothetical protein